MNAILLALLFAASEGDLAERLRRSVDAGTGGPLAKYVLCHVHAIEEFADGHQTPALVTDEDVWEDVLVERREIPFDAPIFERERSLYREFYAAFNEKGLELAREIARARDPGPARQKSNKLSTETTKASRELAAASLARIRNALPPDEEDAFMKFLDARRRLTVVIRLDYTKIKHPACP